MRCVPHFELDSDGEGLTYSNRSLWWWGWWRRQQQPANHDNNNPPSAYSSKCSKNVVYIWLWFGLPTSHSNSYYCNADKPHHQIILRCVCVRCSFTLQRSCYSTKFHTLRVTDIFFVVFVFSTVFTEQITDPCICVAAAVHCIRFVRKIGIPYLFAHRVYSIVF